MAPLKSWLQIDPRSHFSIHNLPFGIISTAVSPKPRVATAIGDYALDLEAFTQGNGFARLSPIQPHQAVFSQPTLNAFAALGRPMHRVVREYLQSIFLKSGPFPDILQENEVLQKEVLVPLENCKIHLPMHIGDYTVCRIRSWYGLSNISRISTLDSTMLSTLDLCFADLKTPFSRIISTCL